MAACATEVLVDRKVVACDFSATVVLAAVFDATVLDAGERGLCVPALDALALVVCALCWLAAELVWARAIPAAGRLTKAAMRQISLQCSK